ncbi:hypothetical protein J4E85_004011 [Alternaria conjuncta]|uniref:uncharacterized protein n=1 Tax=Alternaria conjuncta TaxID=181017 RepID=UPI002220F704|nr:uncharacterized protein J4E85_004011 [Alternaria conjuncta]KAI4931418.1 hypothetical protein J4E85_004011 [Alternaria conjuncta]
MTPTHEEKFFQHKNMQSCLAVNCRFCKWERELDGVPVEEVAPPSPSTLEKIRLGLRVRAAARKYNETEREWDGTASTSWDPDDARWDMNPLASPLVSRSRRDSIHSCEEDGMEDREGVEVYYTEQSASSRDGKIDKNTPEDIEIQDNDTKPPSPTPSSAYSTDNPLALVHSPLYTQSESDISDLPGDSTFSNFLDEVLLDLGAWLDAGGLEKGGLHDDMPEEEYAEYKEWNKAIGGGVARGMVERGVMGVERRRRWSV